MSTTSSTTPRAESDDVKPSVPDSSGRQHIGIGQIASRYGLLSLALVLVFAFSLLLPKTFPTSTTALAILDAQAVIAMLALAETIVVIVGEFDLSVGFLIGLSHILVLSFIVKNGMPWGLAVVLVIAIGLFVGLVNGLLVHVAKIDSFIATLGLGTIIYSISNWYTSSQQVTGKLPKGFLRIYSTKPFGIPISAVYVLGLLLVLWTVLEFTQTGRYLYALGGNRREVPVAFSATR